MTWKPTFPVMPSSPSTHMGLPGPIPGVLPDLPLLASRSHSYSSSCPKLILFLSDDKTKPSLGPIPACP